MGFGETIDRDFKKIEYGGGRNYDLVKEINVATS